VNIRARPKRRSIRLPDYDYSTPAAYFVTICARGREPLFLDEFLRQVIEDTWKSLPERFPSIMLDAFVIMPNHIHFIVHLTAAEGPMKSPALSDIIRVLKSKVALEWLRHAKVELNQSGQVWQRNYFERIIRDEHELNRVREYIASNPAKWAYDRENPGRTADREYEKAWSWIEVS
jgi:REP element-mobilizing transposase RayT